MSATHKAQSSETASVLYMAIDLGVRSWTLASTIGAGQRPRMRQIIGGGFEMLLREIEVAKRRFGLPEDAPVVSCYEAGLHGFWPHRRLLELGVQNIVVDSSSIEVNRRGRVAKSDKLDAGKLATMLVRWRNGEAKVWRVVNVPSAEDEDKRQPHRELMSLKGERTEHTNRIKGLAFSLGFDLYVDRTLPVRLAQLRERDDAPLPPGMYERLMREYERWKLVDDQIAQLELERAKRVQNQVSPQADMVRRLLDLRGVGFNGAWLLVHEIFGWRQIKNRRQLGGLSGLTPTPYSSGDSNREQGISKAGNRRLRALMIELAWTWLRYQPTSALSLWYQRRFALGGMRQRRIGIVALSRKLLVALWMYVDWGVVPEGAVLVTWEEKLARSFSKAALK
jgi:transposase